MAYGWRARLGFILPMDNAVLEPEFYGLRLRGVASYVARMTTDKKERMPENGIELSGTFAELGVNAVGYACAETSFLRGEDANVTIAREIEERTGYPAVTATSAMVEALRELGVARIALAAPYREASARALGEYLEGAGIQVVSTVTRDFSEGSPDPREWYETNLQPPTTAYRMARDADRGEADAVLIAATNLRTFEIIADLERDLGKPVVSSNTALLWAMLRRCGVGTSAATLGRLWQQEGTGSDE